MMVTLVRLHGVGGRTMVLFAKCLLLLRIVVLVVAPWYDNYGGCNGLVHDCCTVMVFVAPM